MKKNKRGFSLIELTVVIALIGILFMSFQNINFNPGIDKQNSLLFANSVFTNIETLRNNGLLGKGIQNGNNMIYPEKWIVHIDTSVPPGSIQGYYSGTTLSEYREFQVQFINNFSKISGLDCYDINGNNKDSVTNVDIEIKGSALSLSGCTTPKDKILDIKTEYKEFKKTIRINTVTGVIEKRD